MQCRKGGGHNKKENYREEDETVPAIYMDALYYATLKFKKLTFWELPKFLVVDVLGGAKIFGS